jgi:hypothetical protein
MIDIIDQKKTEQLNNKQKVKIEDLSPQISREEELSPKSPSQYQAISDSRQKDFIIKAFDND